MPRDDVPAEGWAFWTYLAVASGVLVGLSLPGGRWWVTVLGMLAVTGALNQAIVELRRDREAIEQWARQDEHERIRTALRDAAKARLDELNRRQP